MKKIIILLTTAALFLNSCKQHKDKLLADTELTTQKYLCDKVDKLVLDTVFNNTSILTSFYYDKDCKIQRLELITKLDERSGTIENQENIKNISLTTGLLKDSIYRVNIPFEDKLYYLDSNKNLLFTEIHFDKPFFDSINFIELKTFVEKVNISGEKIVISDSYFYNDTAELLEIENTYLDYDAFKKRKVVSKVISVNNKTIDTLMLTVKVVQNIDDIKKIDISINNKLNLNFKSSIKANFKDFKTESNGYQLVSFLKMSPKFVQIKLKIEKADFKEINKVDIKFNNKEYR